MSSERPAVSVLLPVYNAGRYLSEALESVLRQTFTDFEVIAINDGSTDRSGEILRAAAERDPRVRVTSRPNAGIVQTLNEAIKQSRAELLARMDADDVCEPERFTRQVDYMAAHPDCVAVGSRVRLIDPFGGELEIPQHELEHEKIDAELLDGRGWAIVHPAVMMRKSAVLQAGGYRRQYQDAEDLDLFLRLAELGRLANLPEHLLRYRQHVSSVSAIRSTKQNQTVQEVVRDARKRRGIPDADSFVFQGGTKAPPDRQYCIWAWKAIRDGRLAHARRFALSSIRHKPSAKEAWTALYCAFRGH